jgi:hypothetical protein
MADTHEEQLLSELLGEIAREDARWHASHLEGRVLEAAADNSRTRPSRWRVWVALPSAAALALTVAMTVVRHNPEPSLAPAAPPTVETTVAIDRTPPAVRPQSPKPDPVRDIRRRPSQAATANDRSTGRDAHPTVIRREPAPIETAAADSPIEFVPLLPMSEQELTGSLQIVRVQMPNASLGALRSPLRSPSDLVEADVLLGEDGRARAIRLNTNGSIFPWRSR